VIGPRDWWLGTAMLGLAYGRFVSAVGQIGPQGAFVYMLTFEIHFTGGRCTLMQMLPFVTRPVGTPLTDTINTRPIGHPLPSMPQIWGN